MDAKPHISDSLHESEIFKGLAGKQYLDIIKRGRSINFQSKNILFHQGDPAINCFLVKRGRLKLTKLNEQGREVILRYIGTGEVTAAIVVFENRDYPVTAESVVDTDVIVWDRPTMTQLFHQYPDLPINILDIILKRLDNVQNRYLEVCTEQVNQRIARTLLRFMRRAGSKTRAGIQIDFPISRQNIADYSGTTLYTVSRTLSAWEKIGWIKSGREHIIITDPHALVRFSETG